MLAGALDWRNRCRPTQPLRGIRALETRSCHQERLRCAGSTRDPHQIYSARSGLKAEEDLTPYLSPTPANIASNRGPEYEYSGVRCRIILNVPDTNPKPTCLMPCILKPINPKPTLHQPQTYATSTLYPALQGPSGRRSSPQPNAPWPHPPWTAPARGVPASRH